MCKHNESEETGRYYGTENYFIDLLLLTNFYSPNFFLLHSSLSYIRRLFINNTLHAETFVCFTYANPQL